MNYKLKTFFVPYALFPVSPFNRFAVQLRYPLSAINPVIPSKISVNLRNQRLKFFVSIRVNSWFRFFSLWPKFFRVNPRYFQRNLRLNLFSLLSAIRDTFHASRATASAIRAAIQKVKTKILKKFSGSLTPYFATSYLL